MSHQLIIFTDPPDANCFLTTDSGVNLIGRTATHSSGRLGIGFNIPDGQPEIQGALLRIEKQNWIPMEMRGILELKQDNTALFITDDFHLIPKPIVPPFVPPPVLVPPIVLNETPIQIINRVYRESRYLLSTKEGCGTFTEACEKELHDKHSTYWGHIKKIPPQNHYPEEPYVPGGNVHAVDALMLLHDVGETNAGIYDIVSSSESDAAKPQLLYKGTPNPEIWYHPV